MRPVWLTLSLVFASFGNIIPVLGAASTGRAALVGTIGILTASYVIALCVARGLVGEPLLLSPQRTPDDNADAAGSTLLLGVLVSAVVGPAAYMLVSGEPAAILLLSLALPVLLLQDTLRYEAFALGRPYHAAASDILWATCTAGATVWAVSSGRATALVLLSAWIAGGVLGALQLLLFLRVRPRLSRALAFLADQRRVRFHLASDALLTTGSLHASVLIAAAVIGLEGVGVIRFLQTLFGPVTLLFGVLYVEFMARSRLDAQRLGPWEAAIRMAGVLTVVTVLLSGGLALIPNETGDALAGQVFLLSMALLAPFASSQVAAGVGTAAVTGLRLAGRSGTAAAIRAVWAGTLLLATLTGGLVAGVAGYVWASAAVHLFAAALWWYKLFLDQKPRETVEAK